MRIVITGAGGFVGRRLIARLASEHALVGIDTAALPRGCRAVLRDLGDPRCLDEAFADGCDAVVHLATVPGGAAEADPIAARRVNLDATLALADRAAEVGATPRFLFASSIAVFGDPLLAAVDDATPLAPRLFYGAHKAMIETWLATLSRRGAIDALSLRLPGIVARPRAPSGMASAFMSDVFHALRDGTRYVLPVSPVATMWLMSRDRLIDAIVHALGLDGAAAGESRALTLPALRVRMDALVAAIAQATRADAAAIGYAPDPSLEAAFGRQPPLATPAADALGFTHDGDTATLVARALAAIEDPA